MTVAALYVDPAGVYANLPGVEVWGSRLYKPEHDRDRPRVDALHSVTPIAFRDALLGMARSASVVAA